MRTPGDRFVCTSTVLGAGGYRACQLPATLVATDVKSGERYFRCKDHGNECKKRFGYNLEPLVHCPECGGSGFKVRHVSETCDP